MGKLSRLMMSDSTQLSRVVKIALLLGIGSVLTTGTSLAFRHPVLTPILGAAVPYPIFLWKLRRGEYGSCFAWMLVWGVIQSGVVIVATIGVPEAATLAIWKGSTYSAEMFHWIQTGEGAEGSLSLFLPIHLRDYLLFCGLSLMTVSSAALVLGTLQLNYMNFYVAELIQHSVHPVLAMAVAWPLWSILRVIGFILTGIALGAVALAGWCRWRGEIQGRIPWRYWGIGVGFVVADVVVKAGLAPVWRQLLRFVLMGNSGG